MPGAASLTMMNHLYTRAARDGTIKVLHAKAGDSLRVDQKILEFA